MAYRITAEPKNPIPGIKPTTVPKDTATEAFLLVRQLEASGFVVEIKTEAGAEIGRQELQTLAEKEQH